MLQVEIGSTSSPGSPVNDQALLHALASDDAFRASLEAHPAAALAQFGFEVDPATLPAAVTLPAKDAVGQALRLDGDVGNLARWYPFLGGTD